MQAMYRRTGVCRPRKYAAPPPKTAASKLRTENGHVEPPPPPAGPFMRVSPSIRFRILHFLFRDLEVGRHPARYAHFSGTPTDDPIAILLTCRKLLREGRQVYLSRTMFAVHIAITPVPLYEDLDAWNPLQSAWQRVELDRVLCVPIRPHVASLMKRCTIHLQDINIAELAAITTRSGIEDRAGVKVLKDYVAGLSALAPYRLDPLISLTLDLSSWVWMDWRDSVGCKMNCLYAKAIFNGLYSLCGCVERVHFVGTPREMRMVTRELGNILVRRDGESLWVDWFQRDQPTNV